MKHMRYFLHYNTKIQFWLNYKNYKLQTNMYTIAKVNFINLDKNLSGDEIANVNFYAVRPEATQIRWNNAK